MFAFIYDHGLERLGKIIGGERRKNFMTSSYFADSKNRVSSLNYKSATPRDINIMVQ